MISCCGYHETLPHLCKMLQFSYALHVHRKHPVEDWLLRLLRLPYSVALACNGKKLKPSSRPPLWVEITFQEATFFWSEKRSRESTWIGGFVIHEV